MAKRTQAQAKKAHSHHKLNPTTATRPQLTLPTMTITTTITTKITITTTITTMMRMITKSFEKKKNNKNKIIIKNP